MLTMLLLSQDALPQLASGKTTAQGDRSFSQTLTALMMSGSLTSGSFFPSSASTPNSLDSLAPSMSTMPMMLTLLEKLISSNLAEGVNNSASSTKTSEKSDSKSVSNTKKQTEKIEKVEKDTGNTRNATDGSIPSGRPVQGAITQMYHSRHIGIDFGIVNGTPIESTQSGKVTYAGWNSQGYGNLVIVDNGTYQTYYGHLSSVQVKVGQEVNPGTQLGLSGNTGNSTGPHLHYEIRKNNFPIDPTKLTLG